MTRQLRINRKIILFTLSLLLYSGDCLKTFATALPAEYVATQRWRYLFSTQTPVSNPALMNEANYLSFRYAFSSSLSEYKMQEFGVVAPLGLYQSFGATMLWQGVSTYNQTNTSGDSIGTVNDNQYYFMLSYAYNIWRGLSLGINLNTAIYPFNNSSLSLGADVGLTYRMINNPVIGSHLLSLSLQNIFPVTINSSDHYPRNLRLSLNSTYWQHTVESGFDLAFKDLFTPASQFDSNFKPTSEWDLNAKLGFWILRMFNTYGLMSMTQDGISAWGFAFGFNVPSVNNGRDLSFIYQYLTSPDNNLNGTHTVYVKGDLGKHREEIYARKMARMANVSPNNLYTKAIELYSQGNYWDAFFVFSQLYVEFPDFFKNDWVNYYLGSCQEKLDMRETSEEAYLKAKSQYPRSGVIPFIDLGLMRIYYRDDNTSKVERQFNELNKAGVPDSVKYHGYYLMAESEIKNNNYSKARQLFDLIPENHPDYAFAQHSSAIAAAATEKYSEAVTNLENCIQSPASNGSQKEIVNRSYVFLGYIFYEELTREEGSLSKAVTSLRMVPKNSFYYTDALLGLGWTALKARQWSDCISAGQELASSAKNTILKCEGKLLQAYANMMQKNNAAAVSILENASAELEAFQNSAENEFKIKRQEYEGVRSRYMELAKSAYDIGTTRQSSLVEKQIDSLGTMQKQYHDNIKKFMLYSDDYQRNSFFNRNIEMVKEDINYALAKAQKASGTKVDKASGELKKKEDKIDDEIERLKKELEKQQNQ
jgi:tetratricopeptide (TPR) repeat protein